MPENDLRWRGCHLLLREEDLAAGLDDAISISVVGINFDVGGEKLPFGDLVGGSTVRRLLRRGQVMHVAHRLIFVVAAWPQHGRGYIYILFCRVEVRVQFQDRQGQTDGSIHIVLLFGPLCRVNSSTGPSGAIIGFILGTEAATLVLRYRVHLLLFIF